ncbi:hypothetical protein [Halobacillus mangrovi]|uniref:Lipoprotein n=1 Tax=Halobacillus mangrovi TaxID=402384 RepID=A0A1W5ZX33_9BACI|nr:hypothetical protein [Halobacillus mangrovi]ARI77865.1 hypothetical protein HM131_13850 [Halobacillus mangrovi]
MSKVNRGIVTIITLFLLSGCMNNASYVLRSENVLPKDFYSISFSPEKGYPEFLVMKATDQTTFKELWNFYNFSGEVSKLDFDKKGVLFIGTYESSCESFVSSVKDIENEIVIDIDTEMGTGGCADIADHRSFIVEWDKRDLKKHNHVVFSEGHEEVKVPFKEIKDINKE